jgi:hypothetical protein
LGCISNETTTPLPAAPGASPSALPAGRRAIDLPFGARSSLRLASSILARAAPIVDEPRLEPVAAIRDRREVSPVCRNQQTRETAEPRVGRRELQTAAILETSHAHDGRVERMQQDRLRPYHDRLGTGAGGESRHHRQHDGGRRETEAIGHDHP